MSDSLERGLTRVTGFTDPEMDYQLMRQLGVCRYGGSSVGEVLAIVNNIKNAEPASWVAAFAQLAKNQEHDAQTRAQKGHAISARDQYLVACNSYRAAEYYSVITEPAHKEFGLASRRCFLEAMSHSNLVCEQWWFQLNEQQLPAYYIHHPNKKSKRVLAIISGFDGTLEETWLVYGAAAFERGYDVVLFTGPGQMDTWRFNDNCHFVPDYENIGRLVIDHILENTGAKTGKIALMGISFGGYFAIRIAAHEPRIGALIPNSPIIDLHLYMTSFAGVDPAELPESEDFGPEDLKDIPENVMDKQKKSMSANLMLRFGQTSFRNAYLYLRRFKVNHQDLANIRCPSLALVGKGEGANPLRQAADFANLVGGPIKTHIFTAAQGADGHCQNSNPAFSAAVSMDWLDETMLA